MSTQQLDMLRERTLELLADVRPDAVGLVDAFDFHDHLLSSVLGRYDGNVYENLYKWAQQSPLNQTQVSTLFWHALTNCIGLSKNNRVLVCQT